jgi:transcriptional regulator with XRE-family HTH domain
MANLISLSEFGDRLCALRQGRGMSQHLLEDLLGCARGHCSDWERGKVYPRLDVAFALAALLRVSMEDLFTSEEAPAPYYQQNLTPRTARPWAQH